MVFEAEKIFFVKKNVQPLILTTIEIRLIENVLNNDYNELHYELQSLIIRSRLVRRQRQFLLFCGDFPNQWIDKAFLGLYSRFYKQSR